jgi:hypothetical protein
MFFKKRDVMILLDKVCVVLMHKSVWSTLRKEQRLRSPENRVPRIFGPKREGRPFNHLKPSGNCMCHLL